MSLSIMPETSSPAPGGAGRADSAKNVKKSGGKFRHMVHVSKAKMPPAKASAKSSPAPGKKCADELSRVDFSHSARKLVAKKRVDPVPSSQAKRGKAISEGSLSVPSADGIKKGSQESGKKVGHCVPPRAEHAQNGRTKSPHATVSAKARRVKKRRPSKNEPSSTAAQWGAAYTVPVASPSLPPSAGKILQAASTGQSSHHKGASVARISRVRVPDAGKGSGKSASKGSTKLAGGHKVFARTLSFVSGKKKTGHAVHVSAGLPPGSPSDRSAQILPNGAKASAAAPKETGSVLPKSIATLPWMRQAQGWVIQPLRLQRTGGQTMSQWKVTPPQSRPLQITLVQAQQALNVRLDVVSAQSGWVVNALNTPTNLNFGGWQLGQVSVFVGQQGGGQPGRQPFAQDAPVREDADAAYQNRALRVAPAASHVAEALSAVDYTA
ncbi:MAG: hypothetical protein OWS74_01460 [Firmicutes bacterium]|nr:hypothetical protein [Bacillota bacterium]